MPELPEVELAVRRLRPHLEGRRIAAIVRHHAATRRALPSSHARAAAGRDVVALARRGKYQLVRLDGGATLVAHFRLDGDWAITAACDPLPRFGRVSLELDDDTRVTLVDPRALATITWHRAGHDPVASLGPEPFDPTLTPGALRAAFARRRAPIKLVLLDQHVLAGVGNIYAAEALWHARVHPDAPAASLSPGRVARLLDGVRLALARGLGEPGRVFATDQTGETTQAFMAYGREGAPCHRCGRPIRRVVHAARGTWYCPSCQR